MNISWLDAQEAIQYQKEAAYFHMAARIEMTPDCGSPEIAARWQRLSALLYRRARQLMDIE